MHNLYTLNALLIFCLTYCIQTQAQFSLKIPGGKPSGLTRYEDTLYFWGENHVWKSTDWGESMKKVARLQTGGYYYSYPGFPFWDYEHKRMYGYGDFNDQQKWLFRSDDYGMTWDTITLPVNGVSFKPFLKGFAAQNDTMLFCGYQSFDGGNKRLGMGLGISEG